MCAPWSVAVHHSGKFVYVANEGSYSPTGVSIFSIDGTTGTLTSVGTVSSAGRAGAVAIDPTGKFAYVANGSNSSPGEANSVSMYTVNATTGALTPTGTIAAGSNPTSIAIDPFGKFAYVTNSDSNNVSMYTIDTTTGGLNVHRAVNRGNKTCLGGRGSYAASPPPGRILRTPISTIRSKPIVFPVVSRSRNASGFVTAIEGDSGVASCVGFMFCRFRAKLRAGLSPTRRKLYRKAVARAGWTMTGWQSLAQLQRTSGAPLRR